MALQTAIHLLLMNLLSFSSSFRNDALYTVILHVMWNRCLFRDFSLRGADLWLCFVGMPWIRRWLRILDFCAVVAGFGGENMEVKHHSRGACVKLVSLFLSSVTHNCVFS